MVFLHGFRCAISAILVCSACAVILASSNGQPPWQPGDITPFSQQPVEGNWHCQQNQTVGSTSCTHNGNYAGCPCDPPHGGTPYLYDVYICRRTVCGFELPGERNVMLLGHPVKQGTIDTFWYWAVCQDSNLNVINACIINDELTQSANTYQCVDCES